MPIENAPISLLSLQQKKTLRAKEQKERRQAIKLARDRHKALVKSLNEKIDALQNELERLKHGKTD